jgi:transcriptional regulator with XRE-family HTH domain
MQDARETGAKNLGDVEQRAVEADPAVLEDAGTDAMQAAARMPSVEVALSRYHPDFGDSARGERIKLLMRGAEHFHRAWWAFQEFCQVGSPRGRPRGKAKDPEKDMRAAELRYAQGLTRREIGVRVGIPRTENDVRNNDHGTISRAINRGWALLAEELGEERRDEHIEARRRWYALDARERRLQLMTKIFGSLPGRSPEEAEAMRPSL